MSGWSVEIGNSVMSFGEPWRRHGWIRAISGGTRPRRRDGGPRDRPAAEPGDGPSPGDLERERTARLRRAELAAAERACRRAAWEILGAAQVLEAVPAVDLILTDYLG